MLIGSATTAAIGNVRTLYPTQRVRNNFIVGDDIPESAGLIPLPRALSLTVRSYCVIDTLNLHGRADEYAMGDSSGTSFLGAFSSFMFPDLSRGRPSYGRREELAAAAARLLKLQYGFGGAQKTFESMRESERYTDAFDRRDMGVVQSMELEWLAQQHGHFGTKFLAVVNAATLEGFWPGVTEIIGMRGAAVMAS